MSSASIPTQKAARGLRVAFRSFGCKLNIYEASGMGQRARALGHNVDTWEPGTRADVVVVNSCSVTMRADQETRQFVRRVHRESPGTRVVVTGCYAQRAPQELAALPGVALVAGHAEKDGLAAALDALPGAGEPARVAVAPIGRKGMPALRATGVEGRTRGLLRVQDGCDCACTYCIIPKTRGASDSLPFPEAVEEGRRLLQAGFRELVLTGTHLGHYGLDLTPRRRLSDLVDALLATEVPHAFRLRLSSIEPQEIDGRLIDLMAGHPVMAPHLHLPLQSGSDVMLRAMRRAYRLGNYRKQVERLSRAVSPLSLGADVILGFPGETEQDFRDTLAFIRDLPFTDLHVFTYSPRPGTPAASWAGRPPGDMAKRRVAQTRALVAHKNRVFREGLRGRETRVLVEEDQGGRARGTADTYVNVVFAAPRDLVGRLVRVRLDALRPGGMTGTLLEAFV